MCALSAVLRSKPEWWTKYTDPAIRARWKSEAVGAPVPYGDIPLTEDEVEYVLDELEHYAAWRDPEMGIEVRSNSVQRLAVRSLYFRLQSLRVFGSPTT